VVASHVIEHVPDVIGWLDEVAQLLFDDGRLVLAIPDRRFSFDALRPATTVGQMLLAHRARDVTPSVRAVYDHYSQAVTFNPAAAWLGLPPDPNQRIHDLDYVLAQLARCEDGQYVDCHVWLFTPRSFIEQLQELERLDLVSFVVDEIVLPRQGEFEFYVRLRRISRELDGPEREAMRRAGMRTWIEGRRFDERIDSSDTFSETATAGLSRSELKLIRFKRRAAGKSRRVAHGVLARLPGRS